MRKGSGPRVMAVLRSLNIDLCTVSGKASLAAANRHDMCNLKKPVEPVSIPNRERNDPDFRRRRYFDKRHDFGIVWDSPARCRVAPITGGGA